MNYLSECCHCLAVFEVRKLAGIEPGSEWLDVGDDGRVLAARQPLLALALSLGAHDRGSEHPGLGENFESGLFMVFLDLKVADISIKPNLSELTENW